MDVNELKDYVDSRLLDVGTRMNNIEKSIAVTAVHNENVEKRLASIEGTLLWLGRLIIGALLLGFIAFIIAGGLAV